MLRYRLRNIPIFVLVGSSDEELIARSYLSEFWYNECKKKSFPWFDNDIEYTVCAGSS